MLTDIDFVNCRGLMQEINCGNQFAKISASNAKKPACNIFHFTGEKIPALSNKWKTCLE